MKQIYRKRSHTLADVRIDLEKTLPAECGARLSDYRNKTSKILSPPTSIFLHSKIKKQQLNKHSWNKAQRMSNRPVWKMCTSCKQIASVSSEIHLTLHSWPGSHTGSPSPHNLTLLPLTYILPLLSRRRQSVSAMCVKVGLRSQKVTALLVNVRDVECTSAVGHMGFVPDESRGRRNILEIKRWHHRKKEKPTHGRRFLSFL